MKLKQELQEIKNKDLSSMSEKELKEYKAYLEDLNKNAEVKSKSKKWKNINKFGGTAVSLVALGFALYGLYYLLTTILIKPLLLGFVTSTVLLSATNFIRRIFKKTEKNCQEIKTVCNSKLVEVEKQIAVLEIKKELNETKESAKLETTNTFKQELNNTATVVNNKDQGIER